LGDYFLATANVFAAYRAMMGVTELNHLGRIHFVWLGV
jgi:hypothetical protein